jgi:hypothetical protein
MFENLERFVNELSDADHAWWPFLFLRPAPRERFSSMRVVALAILYGVLPALGANVVARATGDHARTLHPLFFPLATPLLFFALFRFTVAACWNRRADRLARGMRG